MQNYNCVFEKLPLKEFEKIFSTKFKAAAAATMNTSWNVVVCFINRIRNKGCYSISKLISGNSSYKYNIIK